MKDLINIIIMIKMKKNIYKKVLVILFNKNLNDLPKKYSWNGHWHYLALPAHGVLIKQLDNFLEF